MFQSSPRTLTTTEVTQMLHTRFYRHHNVALNRTQNKLQLIVKYESPKHHVQAYNKTIQELTTVINNNGLAHIFYHALYECKDYPDFVLLDDGKEIMDLPCVVNLTLYDSSEFFL